LCNRRHDTRTLENIAGYTSILFRGARIIEDAAGVIDVSLMLMRIAADALLTLSPECADCGPLKIPGHCLDQEADGITYSLHVTMLPKQRHGKMRDFFATGRSVHLHAGANQPTNGIVVDEQVWPYRLKDYGLC
jgi:hypothetical protein